MKTKKQIKYRYSGEQSKQFWKRINALPNEADRQELYSLGVMLQNMESFVLKQLNSSSKGSVKPCKL